MLPKELAKKVRYIQIYSSKAVNDVLSGEYSSSFKGKGMEFDEVREYSPGDDIRSIDWNVTARTGNAYIKRFVEEHEQTIMFLVDLSASGTFGSKNRSKNETAAELCALLSFSAIKNNDKVGLVAFTDQVELFIPPAKGVSHVLRVVRDILQFQPNHTGTDINCALDFLGRVMPRRCIAFLVSDFFCTGYEKKLGTICKRHEILAFSMVDTHEQDLPNVGLLELEDAETGELCVIDTGSSKVRSRHKSKMLERQENLETFFRKLDIDHGRIVVGDNYVKDLILFFRRRAQRRRLS